MHVLLSKWAPPAERSVMAALVYAGTSLGTVISMLMAGVLTANVGKGYFIFTYNIKLKEANRQIVCNLYIFLLPFSGVALSCITCLIFRKLIFSLWFYKYVPNLNYSEICYRRCE